LFHQHEESDTFYIDCEPQDMTRTVSTPDIIGMLLYHYINRSWSSCFDCQSVER